MSYRGKYIITKPEKYAGDVTKVRYLSLWERQTFIWMESNSNIVKWCSEELILPYKCGTDGRMHRYYTDLMFETKNGDIYVIEIKPHKQTLPPIKGKRKTKRYINETMAYIKNISKWKAARAYCEQHGFKFEIWDEHVLIKLGIKIAKK